MNDLNRNVIADGFAAVEEAIVAAGGGRMVVKMMRRAFYRGARHMVDHICYSGKFKTLEGSEAECMRIIGELTAFEMGELGVEGNA